MPTLTRAGSVLLLSLLIKGCSPTERGVGTIFVDSAGVTWATAEAPAWKPGEGWRIPEEPHLQIGVLDGPEEYIFSDLVGAVRLIDGRIVVADRGSADLRFYSPTGEFLSRTGGEGEGPGEFRSLDYIGLLPGDSLVAFDGRLGRIQVFDPSGTFLRSLRVESSWPQFIPEMMIGVLNHDRVVMEFGGFATEVPTGIVRWPPEMVVSVDIRTGTVDSLLVVPGREASVIDRGGGGYSQGTVAFGKANEFASGFGQVAVISTEAIAVHLFGATGRPRRIVRRLMVAEAVTQEHVDDLVEGIVGLVFPQDSDPPTEDVARLRQIWEETPRAPTLPLVRSVHFDVEGNLWLEQYFHMGAPPAPFQVFSSEGVWLGQVTLPPRHHRGVHPRRAPSFQIGEDFILGVWTDEMDVQYVRMYGLEKG